LNYRKFIPTILYLVVLFLILSWASGLMSGSSSSMPYSQVIELFQQEQVKSFVVNDNTITLELREPVNGRTQIKTNLAQPELFRSEMEELFQEQHEKGILESYDFIPAKSFSVYDIILPLLIVGAVLLILWTVLMGRMNGSNPMANFGKARTVLGVPDGKKVTFDDVAGADEEKEELEEIVDFLRNPQKFTQIGARIPHGILLVGPPGTGKTLLARAVAGEAGVQFLSIFIDEIDAVGRKRGTGLGGGHDEKEQTLNQLLVEMDGFGHTEGIIVLAATNRPDILDPALLRPGRFDRQIQVNAPDVKGREEILKVHAKDKKLDDSVNLRTVARATSGFTGADLSNLLNEAAILAARENRPVLNMEDINEALMKIVAGPAKKSHVQSRRDLKTTAIHEAGHAVAMYRLPSHDPVRQISIVPRGRSLGATWYLPKDDSSNLTRNEMYEQIVGLLGGRVAEALYVGDISVGASNDIDRATKLAKDMVARYGMCEKLGTVSYLDDGEVFIGRDYQNTKSYSEKVAGTIDEEVKSLIDRAYEDCKAILEKDGDKLRQVVSYLMEHETMTGAQFADMMEGRELSEASATALTDGYGEEDSE